MDQQQQPMDQSEFVGLFVEFLDTLTDGELAEFAAAGIRNLTVDTLAGDERLIAANVFMGQIVHAQMIIRNMDLDALDFFARINALYPVDLSAVGGYNGYVERIRAIAN